MSGYSGIFLKRCIESPPQVSTTSSVYSWNPMSASTLCCQLFGHQVRFSVFWGHICYVKEQSWPLRPWCPFSLRLTLMSRNLVQQEIRIWARGEVIYSESVVNVYLLYTCTTITARMYGPTGDLSESLLLAPHSLAKSSRGHRRRKMNKKGPLRVSRQRKFQCGPVIMFLCICMILAVYIKYRDTIIHIHAKELIALPQCRNRSISYAVPSVLLTLTLSLFW